MSGTLRCRSGPTLRVDHLRASRSVRTIDRGAVGEELGRGGVGHFSHAVFVPPDDVAELQSRRAGDVERGVVFKTEIDAESVRTLHDAAQAGDAAAGFEQFDGLLRRGRGGRRLLRQARRR